MLAACATPPAEPPPAPVPAPAPVIVAPPPACPSCDEQVREVARLTQELSAREAELRELRAAQREQAKTAQETTREVTREVTRAKAKARRLATQADAASYLSEVEVAVHALHAAAAAASASPLPGMAEAFLAAAAEPFARGDYGAAMDRASQSEQVIALATEPKAAGRKPARTSGELLLQVPLPLRAVTDSPVRRQPQAKAPLVGVAGKDTALTAFAWKDGWLRVQTDDGLAGWAEASQLAAR